MTNQGRKVFASITNYSGISFNYLGDKPKVYYNGSSICISYQAYNPSGYHPVQHVNLYGDYTACEYHDYLASGYTELTI